MTPNPKGARTAMSKPVPPPPASSLRLTVDFDGVQHHAVLRRVGEAEPLGEAYGPTGGAACEALAAIIDAKFPPTKTA